MKKEITNTTTSDPAIAGSFAVSGCFNFGQVDEFGLPVKRTKHDHPYNYNGFVTWRGGENSEVTGTIYSDRLLQLDYTRYNKLSKKHFGDEAQMWFDRSSEKIQEFLRDWTNDKNLRLIFVMEYCNQSSGYPLWRFDYASNK